MSSKKSHTAINWSSYQSHGMTKTKTYQIWQAMKARCYRKTHKHYDKYGGRGITVCDSWVTDFSKFLSDMGEKPERLTLDRIDVNGNYNKDNCRWIDMSTQNANKRSKSNTGYLGIQIDKNGYYHVACTRRGKLRATTCKTIKIALAKRDIFRRELGVVVGDCDDHKLINKLARQRQKERDRSVLRGNNDNN